MKMPHITLLLVCSIALILLCSSSFSAIDINPGDPPPQEPEEVRLERISREGWIAYDEILPATLYQMGPASNVSVIMSNDPDDPWYNKPHPSSDENKFVYLLVFKANRDNLHAAVWTGNDSMIGSLPDKMPPIEKSMEDVVGEIAKSMGRADRATASPEELSGLPMAVYLSEDTNPKSEEEFGPLLKLDVEAAKRDFASQIEGSNTQSITFLVNTMAADRGKEIEPNTLASRPVEIRVKRLVDSGHSSEWNSIDKITFTDGSSILANSGLFH